MSAIASACEGSDLEPVALTLDGDRQAFGALWDRHHRRVEGYCHRYLGTVEPAEDAAGGRVMPLRRHSEHGRFRRRPFAGRQTGAGS